MKAWFNWPTFQFTFLCELREIERKIVLERAQKRRFCFV